MMSRTQITLDPETQRLAKRRASEMGMSLAEYVRRLLMRDLGQRKLPADASAVFDLGASRDSDVASNKDRMVAEAFKGERKGARRQE